MECTHTIGIKDAREVAQKSSRDKSIRQERREGAGVKAELSPRDTNKNEPLKHLQQERPKKKPPQKVQGLQELGNGEDHKSYNH